VDAGLDAARRALEGGALTTARAALDGCRDAPQTEVQRAGWEALTTALAHHESVAALEAQVATARAAGDALRARAAVDALLTLAPEAGHWRALQGSLRDEVARGWSVWRAEDPMAPHGA